MSNDQEFWLTRPIKRHPDQASYDVAIPGKNCARLLSRPCDTCVTFPDDRMRLGEARRQEFIETALRRDSYVVCHDTLSTAEPAICRGFWNLHRFDSAPLRVLAAFGLVEESEPPQP